MTPHEEDFRFAIVPRPQSVVVSFLVSSPPMLEGFIESLERAFLWRTRTGHKLVEFLRQAFDGNDEGIDGVFAGAARHRTAR